MATVKHGDDWGRRSARWAGVRSEVVDVGGTRAHLLRTDAGSATPPGSPAHLLVHPMGAGSWSWLDVMRPLSAYGTVIAPDLPGSGRTRPSDRGAGSAEHGARFLVDLVGALGLERVVLHGHSMGGLVSALFAGLAPDRVERMVLTATPLPGRPDPPRTMRWYRTVWRPMLRIAPPLLRIPMRAGIRMKAGIWHRWRENPSDPQLARAMAYVGTDASRISPDLLRLIADEIDRYQLSWRIDAAIAAAISALGALTVDQRRVRRTLERIAAPTLTLWGESDRVVPRELIEELRHLHADWAFQTVEGVGHMLPWEAPETYVAVAGPWSAGSV